MSTWLLIILFQIILLNRSLGNFPLNKWRNNVGNLSQVDAKLASNEASTFLTELNKASDFQRDFRCYI